MAPVSFASWLMTVKIVVPTLGSLLDIVRAMRGKLLERSTFARRLVQIQQGLRQFQIAVFDNNVKKSPIQSNFASVAGLVAYGIRRKSPVSGVSIFRSGD